MARVLFDNFSWSLSDGDRPDGGTRANRKQASLAYVPQDSLFAAGDTVASVLNAALAPLHLEDRESHGAHNLDFQLLFLTPNPGKRVYTP